MGSISGICSDESRQDHNFKALPLRSVALAERATGKKFQDFMSLKGEFSGYKFFKQIYFQNQLPNL